MRVKYPGFGNGIISFAFSSGSASFGVSPAFYDLVDYQYGITPLYIAVSFDASQLLATVFVGTKGGFLLNSTCTLGNGV